jgi:hypothetical protein
MRCSSIFPAALPGGRCVGESFAISMRHNPRRLQPDDPAPRADRRPQELCFLGSMAAVMRTTSGGRLDSGVPSMLAPRGRQSPSRSAMPIARLARSSRSRCRQPGRRFQGLVDGLHRRPAARSTRSCGRSPKRHTVGFPFGDMTIPIVPSGLPVSSWALV